jgi:hypothetical protein
MNQTGIAASDETVSSCTRTDVFYCYLAAIEPVIYRLRAARTPDSGGPLVFTLYLFATESDKFGHCNPVPFAAKRT